MTRELIYAHPKEFERLEKYINRDALLKWLSERAKPARRDSLEMTIEEHQTIFGRRPAWSKNFDRRIVLNQELAVNNNNKDKVVAVVKDDSFNRDNAVFINVQREVVKIKGKEKYLIERAFWNSAVQRVVLISTSGSRNQIRYEERHPVLKRSWSASDWVNLSSNMADMSPAELLKIPKTWYGYEKANVAHS